MEGYRGKGEVIYSALIIPEPNSKGQNVCSIVCNFGHCLLHLVCCLVTWHAFLFYHHFLWNFRERWVARRLDIVYMSWNDCRTLVPPVSWFWNYLREQFGAKRSTTPKGFSWSTTLFSRLRHGNRIGLEENVVTRTWNSKPLASCHAKILCTDRCMKKLKTLADGKESAIYLWFNTSNRSIDDSSKEKKRTWVSIQVYGLWLGFCLCS